MHYNQNELVLLYNSERAKDRKTLAYALTVTSKINRQDLNAVRLSDTMLVMMLDRLGMDCKSLLNKADPYYQTYIRGKEMDPGDWYSVVKHRPSLLRAPVALYRGKAIVCETPTDVYKIAGNPVVI